MSRWKLFMVAAATVLAASCPANAWWTYVSDFVGQGVYDEQATQTNAVDREATGNIKTLAQFKVDIASTYAQNKGSICTFDVVKGYEDGAGLKRPGLSPDGGGRGRNIVAPDNDYPNGDRPTLWMGVSQNVPIQLIPSRCLEIWPQMSYTSVGMPTSGPSLGVGGQVWNTGALCTPETSWWPGDNTKETLTFSQGLLEMAVTLISKDSAYNVDVWVDYMDNTSSSVRSISVAGGAGTDDVFVHFVAGNSLIKAFHWDSDVSRPPIDDLAVIVPEPATMSLLAIAGVGALLRRIRG